jgi:hypothetical protein
MAKPNYAFEKRQRDLAKKHKKEEKLKKKAANSSPAESTPGTASQPSSDVSKTG